MTLEEIEKVTRIMFGADSGCPVCASELVKSLVLAFPEYKEVVIKMYKDEFGMEYLNG